MKKTTFVMIALLFASSANADIVYLNNGQSFQADLIRVTPDQIFVTIGGITEIDFEKSTIARVEDDAGKILYQGKKVIVPGPSGPGPLEVETRAPSEREPAEVEVPDILESELWNVEISDPAETEPSDVEIAAPREAEPSGDDDTGIAHSPWPEPTRIRRFYSRALSEGSISVGGLVSFSSFGGDINEGAYGIEDNERLNLFAIAPSVAYFLFDNIAIGADVMYKREWLSSRFEDQLSLGARAIYAFPLENAFRPYVAAGLGLMRWRFSENESAYSNIGMTVKVGPGVFYFVNEHYAVNMELTYKRDRFGTDLEVYPITGNSVLFSVGLSGFIY